MITVVDGFKEDHGNHGGVNTPENEKGFNAV